MFYSNVLVENKRGENTMSDIVSNIIPIVLLICFGHFIRYKDMLTEDVIKGIRKIVIDISLPAILFITYVNMEIRKEYFVIMIATVFLLFAFYFFVAIRLTVILVVGYLFKFFVIDKIITPDKLFNYAYFTFLILPIPFSLPIFVSQYGTKEDTELSIMKLYYQQLYVL